MDLRQYIYQEIDQVISDHQLQIASGFYTFEEYKKACGVVRGLELAKQIMDETYRKYIKE